MDLSLMFPSDSFLYVRAMLALSSAGPTIRMSKFRAAIPVQHAEPQDVLREIINFKFQEELHESPLSQNACFHCGSACTRLSAAQRNRSPEELPGLIFVIAHGTYTCDNPRCIEICNLTNERLIHEVMDTVITEAMSSPTRTAEDMTSPDAPQRRTNSRRRVKTDEDQESAEACGRRFLQKLANVP